ncbi:ribonuclease H-like domain-containing protein, partial [Tanacetum coccineum]
MVTRSQSGIVKPIDRLSLITSSISPILKSSFLALKDPHWSSAMYDEYNALVKMVLGFLYPGHHWSKARLVANGSSLVLTLMRHSVQLLSQPSFERFLVLSYPVSGSFTNLMLRMNFLTVIDSLHASAPCGLQVMPLGQDFLTFAAILRSSSPILLQQIVDSLHKEFDMTDLGALNYFLGISATRHSTGLFLSQKKYALQLLERAHMVHCNPSRTPVDTESKLGQEGVPVQDSTLEPHFATLKRILRYVRGTMDFGLHLYASATTSLVSYIDADWACCPSTRRSTSGYCVFLCDNLLSWSSKRHHTISRSSAEAEYRGVANVVAETAWIRNLLHQLHSPLLAATIVYCDNVSAVYMSANPVQHQRTKHIEID